MMKEIALAWQRAKQGSRRTRANQNEYVASEQEELGDHRRCRDFRRGSAAGPGTTARENSAAVRSRLLAARDSLLRFF